MTTRADVEQLLHELAGFNADSTDISAAQIAIDDYAATQSGSYTESQLHLLHQHAELLLDSRGSVTALRNSIDDLSERVTLLAARLVDAERGRPEAAIRIEEALAAVREKAELPAPDPAEPTKPFVRNKPVPPAKPVRVRKGATEVWCSGHARWEPASDFFRNTKSRTGFESKCKASARPNRVRAA